jgi:hypothetical protein
MQTEGKLQKVSKSSVFKKYNKDFAKFVLKLKTLTPSYMIYGELGLFPIEIYIYQIKNDIILGGTVIR